jgi:hypothetical protein
MYDKFSIGTSKGSDWKANIATISDVLLPRAPSIKPAEWHASMSTFKQTNDYTIQR